MSAAAVLIINSTLRANYITVTVNVLKSLFTKVQTKWHMQTVQTQIRLLLQLVWVYTFCYFSNYFKKQLHKKQKLGKKL